jgi:hypothetical protein
MPATQTDPIDLPCGRQLVTLISMADAELTGPINARHAIIDLMQISLLLLSRPRAKSPDRVDLTFSLHRLCS